jgi:2-keto-4-pentenoate hydratase/2-oxohepta-3-ene-1,7-dioic acid hydratase in catechol pathway
MDLGFYSGPAATEPERTISLNPGKIVAVGKNYRAHAAELGGEVPAEPLLFFKASSGLIGDGDPFPRPMEFERVDYEGEIGLVIGKRGRRIKAADALAHVLGFVCVNDFTIRDLQRRDSQWARAKGFDGSCSVGPRIVGGLKLADLAVETRLNGELVQSAPASQMAFDIPTIIEFASQYMTLEEGDLIATGTPAGVGNLSPGDHVSVEVKGVGVLANTVVEDRA